LIKRTAVLMLALGMSIPTLWGPSATQAAPGDNRAVNAALSRRLPAGISLKNVALADAIDHIRDLTQANIWVNWRALEAAGISRDTPVNINLRDVTLRKILSMVLSEAGGASALTFQVNDNVIEVTTQELADKEMVTRIYPIDDLIMEIPNFDNAPDFNLQNTNQGGQGGQGGGGGGGGGGLFMGGGQQQNQDDKGKTREERAEEIVQLIMNTVRPEVWRDNGGTASIRHFNGKLVITAPPSVHELIGG
jgi:uncharacterized membrane protein YgcG